MIVCSISTTFVGTVGRWAPFILQPLFLLFLVRQGVSIYSVVNFFLFFDRLSKNLI